MSVRSRIRRLRDRARLLLYPGLDLHTRNRTLLCRFWAVGERDVLDAGSGNGYFAWLAYRSGARVIAMNIDGVQVERSKAFLLGFRGADPTRLAFEHANLYSLATEARQFDEIICYEVLEHIRRDAEVLCHFARILRPGGTLHLCVPNRLHPRHLEEILDLDEQGGHVRSGYTGPDLRGLLEPLGFRVDRHVGVGSKSLYRADRVLRALRNRFGDLAALPFFLLSLPIVWFSRLDPDCPFCIYVTAVKQES